MGFDVSTYRCRVGLFVANRGAGAMSFIRDFSGLVKVTGAVIFIRTLLVMAGIEQNPGPTNVFVFRYQYLLIEVGTEVLRKLFNNKVGNDFMRYLNSNPTQCNHFKYLRNRNVISDAQKKLLPPDDMKPTSSNFDITLLVLLLRNVCGLLDRRDPVWKTPDPRDLSVEADITRLRGCRNYLQHSETVFISKVDLTDKWRELCQILHRLNTVAGIQNLSALIDDAKWMNFGEEISIPLKENITASQHLGPRIGEVERGQGQSIFWYRHIVIDIGTIVLRQLFDGKVGRDFWTNLAINTQNPNRLCLMKSLSVDQKKLLPPLEKNPNSSKFDLTLLTNLLRYVCGLRPPTDPVWWNPESDDISMEADITRFNNCTHKMMHGQTFLPEEELDSRILHVTLILQRLGIGNRELSNTIICAQSLPSDEVVPDDHIIRGNISNQPLEPEIPKTSLLRLTSLSLYGIKMEHNSLEEMVEHLSSNARIEHINFSYVSCYHHQDSDTDCTLTLNLQKNTKLTSLCLYGVNIVCDRVNCFRLQSIKLYPISKRIVDSYIKVFNCIKGSHLKHLDIYGSLARYEDNTMKCMTSAVKTLPHIKSLKLSGILLPDDVSLQLHGDVTQVKIVLEHVTMSQECFHDFTSSCVKAISEAHVELYCCTIKPVGEINSFFEEHEKSVNGATEISHLKSWQNTVRYIYKYFSAAVQVTHQDDCCLHFKSTQRD